MSDDLHRNLVNLGVNLGVQRYAGQHPTEAAHQFADAAEKVIETILQRVKDDRA